MWFVKSNFAIHVFGLWYRRTWSGVQRGQGHGDPVLPALAEVVACMCRYRIVITPRRAGPYLFQMIDRPGGRGGGDFQPSPIAITTLYDLQSIDSYKSIHFIFVSSWRIRVHWSEGKIIGWDEVHNLGYLWTGSPWCECQWREYIEGSVWVITFDVLFRKAV